MVTGKTSDNNKIVDIRNRGARAGVMFTPPLAPPKFSTGLGFPLVSFPILLAREVLKSNTAIAVTVAEFCVPQEHRADLCCLCYS